MALRGGRMGWIRIPAGIALMIGGIFGFLPVLGLALLAMELAFLHEPLAGLLAFINRKLVAAEA